MVGSGRPEVITSKGCSKVLSDVTCTLGSTSFRDLQPPRPSTALHPTPNSPFSGLVICVTGLSKEARKQVMDATERLGGQYTPHLNAQCTHLVVQSSNEFKSGCALKHRATDGLLIVTLGWFVDSVRSNVRLNESLYCVKSFGESHMAKDDINRMINGNSCLPVLENGKQSTLIQRPKLHSSEDQKRRGSVFSGQTVYVDPDVSAELRTKVVEAALKEGALVANQWLVGHDATHVVCEAGSSVPKYLGHSSNLVTPIWVLKTVKEIRSQRLVHLSADLARHVGMMLSKEPVKTSFKENQSIVILAKKGVRNRRMKVQPTPIKPLAQNTLLDTINWTMSEPSSTASISMDSFSFDDAKNEADDCFVNLSRPLSEREKSDVVFGNHFITILFPVDRFAEMGPCSRTFFSDTGFTCSQLLDHIYAFYQENMSTYEIQLAIHTDSRHADRLRSMYSTKEVAKLKRINFLGSRRLFKMLKRIHGDNNNNVYELLTQA